MNNEQKLKAPNIRVLMNPSYVEILPNDHDTHFAADECWCMPDHLMSKHQVVFIHKQKVWESATINFTRGQNVRIS